MSDKCKEPYVCPPDIAGVPDPEHAQFSPVAKQLFIQLLQTDSCREKGNVIVYALYDAAEYAKDSLAFFHNGSTRVLRDDGVYPDRIKNDQEYTVILDLDTAQLRVQYGTEAAISSLSKKGNATYIDFKGREIVAASFRTASTLQAAVDWQAFLAGKKTLLSPEVPLLEEVRNNCLYIIDTKVVEDPSRTFIPSKPQSNPDGAWTFKRIMTNMANTPVTGVSPEDFTLNWLTEWQKANTINGDTYPARSGQFNLLLNNWPRNGSGKLDLNRSPFRLMAIVNRLDLMPNPVFSSENKGGELRFVFSILNPSTMTPFGNEVIIFEFGVNLKGTALQDYAGKWLGLKDLTLGSPEYNALLESITAPIIAPNAAPGKPNGSNLNQLRTNELSFGGWQLREFNIDKTSHLLTGVTIKQEPAEKYNSPGNTAELQAFKKFVDDNEKAILRNHYVIPEKLADGTPFLGGKSNYPNGGVWGKENGFVPNNTTARFIVSINTCSGCHLNESATGFLHNAATQFGSPTSLSAFIKGKGAGLGTNTAHFPMPDPVDPTLNHSFNDLARRVKVLWGYTHSNTTLFGLQYNPVNMEH